MYIVSYIRIGLHVLVSRPVSVATLLKCDKICNDRRIANILRTECANGNIYKLANI